jgi:polysaccharide export outer membrane protein
MVDENGALTLPMLGPIKVTNMTVDQLRNRLVTEYSAQLKNPSIDVSVKRRVSVLGQVMKPGVYAVDPTMRLSDVVALAGGLAEDGTTKNIDVMRGNSILYDNVDASTPAVPNLHSGDMVVVNKKPWIERNGKGILAFGLAVGTLVARLTLWD